MLLFADDIAFAQPRHNAEIVAQAAQRMAQSLEIGTRGIPTSSNTIISPGGFVGGACRRCNRANPAPNGGVKKQAVQITEKQDVQIAEKQALPRY